MGRAVDVSERDGHIRRGEPDAARQCLPIGPRCIGQCLALFDLVLMHQLNGTPRPPRHLPSP